MTKAVESGMPKLRIEESAARRQARIDQGDEVIVGANKYQSDDAAEIDILDVDNAAVRAAQITRLERVRQTRDPARCAAALAALTEAARSGKGNLLTLSIEASRARATVGEISDALETVFTRHRATTPSVVGIYGGQYQGDEAFHRIQREIEGFARDEGRRPRMLVVKLGQDGHDRGARVIATAFADIGFDVDIGPLFQTPEEAARQAVENDVHIVGVSSQAAAHKTLVPALIGALKKEGAGDILVVCGGVIPRRDYAFLKKAGVSAIFGPGTNIPAAAAEILSLIRQHRMAA
jgi:methylmalonyl-CoA mutase